MNKLNITNINTILWKIILFVLTYIVILIKYLNDITAVIFITRSNIDFVCDFK